MSTGRLIDQPTVAALLRHRCYAGLCGRLVDAYGANTQRILDLAGKADVPATALPSSAPAEDLWPQLLAEALNRKRLPALIKRVLADDSVRGHHAMIGSLAELDVAAELDAYVRRIRTEQLRLLEEQYVDLSAAPDRRPRSDSLVDYGLEFAGGWESLPEVEGRYQGAGQHEMQTQPVPHVRERLMTVSRCVLLGEPGSGKTWTLARLLLAYADAWLAAAEGDRNGLSLPVWVSLRKFRGATEAGEAQALKDYMRLPLGPLAPLWDELQLTHPLVVLLDAFNEMPRTSPTGADLVADVKHELRQLRRFVLSCRARDYGNELGDVQDLEQLRLQDLDPPKMLAVIRSRFRDERAENLWAKMGGDDAFLRAWGPGCWSRGRPCQALLGARGWRGMISNQRRPGDPARCRL
ncbi:MAG: NACHT domain-containing protein [Ardenticatenia bacterium]|nr:NACHT domain-containing protein [Ardenticatenia bacterium]